MSKRNLPDWIEGFQLYMRNSEPPDSFVLWTAVSVVASALQRKCCLKWGILRFYPNMFILLVGPSATGKGTAMGPGMDLIKDANIPIAANATSLQALIRRLKQSRNDPVIDQETGEIQPHSSMTIFSKEFTVFLGYHNNELMSALCDWYDCDNLWEYETIARDSEKVHGVWVNLIGGTTPELIRSSMPLDAIGGGLTSRIIAVYAEKKSKNVIIPFQTKEEIELYQYLVWDLERISLLKGDFKYTEGFIDTYTEWCNKTENSEPVFSDPRFNGYLGRRRGHVLKLSMILSASRDPGEGNEDLIITGDDLTRAVEILEKTEVLMPKVFSGMGKSDISGLIPEVISWLALKQRKVSRAELLQQFIADADDFVMERVLRTLEQMQYIDIDVGTVPHTIIYKGPTIKGGF